MASIEFAVQKTVLLTLDVQPAIFKMGRVPQDILEKSSKAVDWARNQGIRVIHIATGFKEGYPEVSDIPENWPAFEMWTAVEKNSMLLSSDKDSFPAPEIYKDKDTVIWKTRASAFIKTDQDLDAVLRGHGIEHIILFGVATSGAVLSTVRQGWDLDWKMTILKDVCWDNDLEVHQVLIEKILAERARVIPLSDLPRIL